MSGSFFERLNTLPGSGLFAVAAAAPLFLALSGCSRPGQSPGASQSFAPGVAAWAAGFPAERLASAACAECHQPEAKSWSASHHAHANRPVDPADDAAAFEGHVASTHASSYRFTTDASGAHLIHEKRRDGAEVVHRPSMVIARDPLWQYLVETASGRFQATEVAWDPNAREWFGVFGDGERNHGEWGHWMGRGMNWNSMCAQCHMTAYSKNYDIEADRYASAWIEHGIGCVQCHGVMDGHESAALATAGLVSHTGDPQRMMQTCASCHSRADTLTPAFVPGEAFDEHYRLQLPVAPGLYHPDGQILDEVFEYGSFRHSRMHAAGVTCMDCHDPHSGGLKLSQEDNSLCLQCHSAPGRLNAPLIDPTAHSFHSAGSAGNRCVECHMGTTTYMQRDPRRDHGFIIPDPVLSRELGVPNACNRCHTEQSLEWSVEHYESWYGAKMAGSRHRQRARAVARAFQSDAGVVAELLELIDSEKVPAWRASLLTLADDLAPGALPVTEKARLVVGDPDALVRAASVHALAGDAASRPLVEAAFDDPARVVRLEAAWALSPVLEEGSRARAELDAHLHEALDQPGGRYRMAQDLFNRGQHAGAAAMVRRAMQWDPLSPAFPEGLGFMLNAQGRPREAAEAFEHATELAPEEARLAFHAALAWSEAGEMSRAEHMLGVALRRDRGLARAWYNLGLLQAQTDRAAGAVVSLREAARLEPGTPDFPYALATVYLQLGRNEEAAAEAGRALALAPGFPGAAELILVAESRAAR